MIVSQLLGGNPEDLLPPLIKIADKRKLKISFMLNRVLAKNDPSFIVSHSIILPINNLKSVKTKIITNDVLVYAICLTYYIM